MGEEAFDDKLFGFFFIKAKVTSLISDRIYYVCFIIQLISLEQHVSYKMCICIVNNRKYFINFENK